MSWSTRFLPALRALGYEIDILFFTEGDIEKCKFLQFFKQEGFTIHHYPHVSFSYFKVRWILRTLRKTKPDIFVPNGFAHAFYASRWVKEAGIPTLGILHSDDEYHYGEIEEFVAGKKEYRVSALVSVSHLLQEKIQQLAIPELVSACIPYGAPTSIFKTDFEQNRTKVLYIGRFSEWQKRISETTHALCRAAKEIEGVEVMMHGGGEVDTVLSIIREHGMEHKVKVGGLVDSEKVQHEMVKHDVFVLLSDFEGLPIALMEAMACGLVPLCKNIDSGIPELIHNNKNGLLVNDRGDEFVEALQRLHQDKNLCKELAKNARNTVLESYSSDYSVKQWDKFLKGLCPVKKDTTQIQIPLFFFLPPVNRKLIREDFRLYAMGDNLKRFVIQPIFGELKLVLRRVLIKLGLGKYFLQRNY